MNSGAGIAASAAPDAARDERMRLAMWIFLAGEMLFFGALLLGYGVARAREPASFAVASGHTRFWLGTLNTAVLLSSSFAIAMAADAEPRHALHARRWLAATALLGITFLVVKGIEYRLEWDEGLFPGAGFHIAAPVPAAAELFFAWYFFVTGLHALHLAAGVGIALGFVGRWPVAPTRLHALALYWHFVDIVWIVLFPLIYLVAAP